MKEPMIPLRSLLVMAFLCVLPAPSPGAGSAGTAPGEPGAQGEAHPLDAKAKQELMAILQRANATKTEEGESLYALQRAGASGCRDFVPVLKQIAEGTEGLLCCNALDALYRLGEPKAYFLELAAKGREKPEPAYYAIYTLARDPDQGTLEALKRIGKDCKHPRIDEAVDIAGWVARIADWVNKLPAERDKARRLLGVMADQIGGARDLLPERGLRPSTVWAKGELRRLSERAPSVAAEEVYDVEATVWLWWDSAECRRRRGYLAPLLCAQAQEHLAALEQEERTLRAGGPPEDDDGAAKLTATLEQVKRGELPLWKSKIYVRRAGASGRREYVPVLKEIAGTCGESRRRRLCFLVLDALWALGERPQYFLDLAQAHDGDDVRACAAVWVLGRDPQEHILQALAQTAERADRRAYIHRVLERARGVAWMAQLYAVTPTTEGKAESLIGFLSMGWRPEGVDEYDHMGDLGPLAVWSRRQLRLLSEQAPREVVGVLVARKLAPGCRAYIARSLHENAVPILQEFEEQEKSLQPPRP